ncbi:diguanylate cyclase [Piscinibacter sp.]|uniref:GGDEF domain-containing protein n=1 Tax=Piscinibacter sp. TaxID=1903157 RepID=UPI0039E4CE50
MPRRRFARFPLPTPARLAGAALALALGAAAWATTPPASPPMPEALRPVLDGALDDPRVALALVDDAALDALDSESRFWRLLGKTALYTLLDRATDAQRAADEARARLGRVPAATPRHHLWLEAYAIGSLFRSEDSAALIARSVELRRAALPIGDEYLLCEIAVGDLFLLRETYAFDEAWRVAEEAERCGRKLGLLHIETSALIALGSMASSLSGKAPAERYFERAQEVLGAQPARFQRGWIEWELGNTLARLGQPERAARAYENSIALSRSIDEPTGAAIGMLDLAALRLAQNDPQRVIELVRGALPALQEIEAPVRMATARGLIIEALARLKRPEVLAEIDKARALERTVLPAPDRARLLQRMAEGYASQGLHAQAYAELRRANEATLLGQQAVRDSQLLRLQARYEIARREAELADLRHRAEADRLALQAREAQQRALWAALAALSGLAVAAGWFGARAWRRRRRRADLVLRDELTGLPDRRAVLAFAQEQFGLCRRLGIELSVAVLDLDHFGPLNERLGQNVGDRVLRAVAQTAREALRGQERIGRWGGDEWLLVMPGTAIDEIPEVFERLRARLAARPIVGLPSPHGITLSMGAASLGASHETVEALVEAAERQLLRAKGEGRDRLRCARSRRDAAVRPAGDAGEAVRQPVSPEVAA